MRDVLTGANTRRSLLEFLERSGNRHTLLLIDIDRFMQLNDLHGHRAGDAVLCEFISVLGDDHFVARFGGDVFALAISASSDALQFAEELRARVEAHRFSFGAEVTVSIGVSTQLDVAEANLRLAKKGGRNRVVG